MGLLDGFRKKPEENSAAPLQKNSGASESQNSGKFSETCAICGKGPTDVKWMGQYFHTKCRRVAKRLAGKMV
ncbi:MAG: hypothetical protein Q7R70_06345 [Candidatus Diapherotrites archaeon]|nr:hypothetical protein [Candidatus Diapherotrites archaeon]